VLFSDEKVFTIEAIKNTRQILKKRQGDCKFYALFNGVFLDAKVTEHVQYPQSLMVWAGISAKGRPELIFFDKNEAFDTQNLSGTCARTKYSMDQ
jgi:hypothetical protein